ncbi:PSP1 domain-containing protein [Gracilinema caldarium]|uniref:PSP1 domain protein n=1 Tax=Gracilinema caldarium (strain ATCC 51460 / DSM 7334 / H1) TaxID=744872 RepID=F8EWQ2_GRAC1|nr:regulatory iron-sulfur-containing complex subunit RicT [Gracilinema caldarium]AEJ18215.1 PSP1 domain protein [Gracilinema caldarium DSM 7334]
MDNEIQHNGIHGDEFHQLEDSSYNDYSDTTGIAVPIGDSTEPLDPTLPVYRLRLPYSHETFQAVFTTDLLSVGAMVIVPTRYGKDIAQIIGLVENRGNLTIGEVVSIDRIATSEDIEKAQQNKEKEKEAFTICREKIISHRLDMKLVSVHYLLEESKILFFFTAESRVDFRELVKDLVSIFKTRIELRQIGVRDESRIVGGLGVCGRGYCCHTVSDKLKPVSIKMAKDQNLSLNSMKISGPCGRLLCCLAYEHSFYNEVRRQLPQEGCKLIWQDANWKVAEVDPVGGKIKVICEDGRQVYVPVSRFEKQDGRWRLIDL